MPRIPPPPPFAGGVETAKEEVLVRIPKRALQISEDKKCVSSFLRFLFLAEEESDDNWSEDEIRISPLNHRKKGGEGKRGKKTTEKSISPGFSVSFLRQKNAGYPSIERRCQSTKAKAPKPLSLSLSSSSSSFSGLPFQESPLPPSTNRIHPFGFGPPLTWRLAAPPSPLRPPLLLLQRRGGAPRRRREERHRPGCGRAGDGS